MTPNQINVALIGCGRIAGHHINSIGAVEGVNLAAVCDLDAAKARPYGEDHDVPWYTNYRTMLAENPGVDTVAIITPSGMHHEHALEMLSDYAKHVIIEKPTFMRPDQLLEAYSVAEHGGFQIFPVFQNRYNKAVRRVKLALERGELGEVRTVSVRLRWCRPQRYYDLAPWRGTYSHDGGALTNQTIHHVDLLRHLGGEVAEVSAIMRTLGADIEVEDTAVATFKYRSGAIGTLEATTAARPDDFEASISFVCAEGLAQIGGIAVNELQIFTPAPEECALNSEDFQGIEGHGAVYGFGHTDMYRDIRTAGDKGAPFPVTQNDALSTLQLLHAFYRSDEIGQSVDVGPNCQSTRLGKQNEAVSELYRTPTA